MSPCSKAPPSSTVLVFCASQQDVTQGKRTLEKAGYIQETITIDPLHGDGQISPFVFDAHVRKKSTVVLVSDYVDARNALVDAAPRFVVIANPEGNRLRSDLMSLNTHRPSVTTPKRSADAVVTGIRFATLTHRN